jgi:hypothetical protein
MSRVKLSLRLVSELAIVFAGVYGAFWVERFRGELEDRERASTILAALEREIEAVATAGPYVRDGMAQALAEHDSAVARGLRPPPAFYREPGAETPSISVWEATVASGGVNLLDPELFYVLAAFYNRVESFSQRYLRYNETTEQEVLPRLSRGAEAFYHPETGQLDPVFEVHMDQLRTLRDETVFILARADSLLEVLQAGEDQIR